MPKWIYTEDPEPRRYNAYGDIGPGDEVEADEQPDWRWTKADAPKPSAPSVPAPPVPVPPAEPETPAES